MARRTYVYSDMDKDLSIGVDGEVNILYDEDVIQKSIKSIFAVITGERIRNPIGSRLVGYLFQPISPQTVLNIKTEIEKRLTQFEPRIEITNTTVRPDTDKNVYNVYLNYRIIGLSGRFAFETKLKSFGE